MMLAAVSAVGQTNDSVTLLRHSRCYAGAPIRKFSDATELVRLKDATFSPASPAVYDGKTYTASSNGRVIVSSSMSIDGGFEVKGSVEATPAVSATLVVVGSTAKFVVAHDRVTGNVRWYHKTKSAVRTSPIIANGFVYASCEDGTVVALDTLGKLKWSAKLKGKPGSPAFDDGLVFVGTSEGKCVALDAITGKQVWTSDAGGRTPAVMGGMVYVINRNGAVIALDEKTGAEKWRYDADAEPKCFEIAVSNEYLAYAEGVSLIVLNAKTGKKEWATGFDRPICGAPMIVGDVVYLPISNWKLNGYDLNTSFKLCSADIGFAPWGSPSYGGGKIFYPNKETLYTFSGEEQ